MPITENITGNIIWSESLKHISLCSPLLNVFLKPDVNCVFLRLLAKAAQANHNNLAFRSNLETNKTLKRQEYA